MIIEVINNIITRVVILDLLKSLKLLNQLEELEVLKLKTINESNIISYFLSSDIEFFDPFYKDKLRNIKVDIEHIEKKIYFRDVIILEGLSCK